MAAVNKPVRAGRTRTKAGEPLTREYEEQLAAEAEAGFEPAELTRRHAGRPSLSGGSGHSSRLGLRVDDDTYQSILRLAERQDRHVSDIVREAIHRYLEAS
jgi:hypothetical protein